MSPKRATEKGLSERGLRLRVVFFTRSPQASRKGLTSLEGGGGEGGGGGGDGERRLPGMAAFLLISLPMTVCYCTTWVLEWFTYHAFIVC